MKNNDYRTQARINPDSRPVLWFTVFLVALLGITSFMVSFNGLHDVASWVGLPGWLRWTVPVFIDIAILAYSMAAVIHRARGEAVALTWATLMVFTLISVFANGAHALAVGEGQTALQSWIGAAIAAAAPLSVFAATEELSRLAFGKSEVEEAPAPTVLADVKAVESLASEDYSVPASETPEEGKGFEYELLAAGEIEEEGGASKIAGDFEQLVSTAPNGAVEAQEVAETSEAQKAPTPVDATSSELEEDEDLAKLRVWVAGQNEAGQKVTGVEAASVIGKSAKTARAKLKALKELDPTLFAE